VYTLQLTILGYTADMMQMGILCTPYSWLRENICLRHQLLPDTVGLCGVNVNLMPSGSRQNVLPELRAGSIDRLHMIETESFVIVVYIVF
jgi:hypothetical protein